MQKYVAALYVQGRIVTGKHHGDAFSKLNEIEKQENIHSGFYDPEKNKFVCDNQKEFYLKKIIMVRHADAEKIGNNPGITEYGHKQVRQTAHFCKTFIDLKDYVGYTSPLKRCQETAEAFCNECNLEFNPTEKLLDGDDEPTPTFIQRLKKLLEELPNKSFLISHCNFIANMAQLATGTSVDLKIQNCSITFIENSTIVQLGKLL